MISKGKNVPIRLNQCHSQSTPRKLSFWDLCRANGETDYITTFITLSPAFGLEIGVLGTRPMAAGVVPDAGHVAVRTSLDMPPESGGPALHDGTRGAPHVAGQRMSAFIVGIARAEDLLQGQESHAVPQHSDCENAYCFIL
jgi:hypothetical protein